MDIYNFRDKPIYLDGYHYSKYKKTRIQGFVFGCLFTLILSLCFFALQSPQIKYETIYECTDGELSQAIEDKLSVIIDG